MLNSSLKKFNIKKFELDRLCAFVLLCTSTVILIISYILWYTYSTGMFTITISSLFYLLFRNTLTKNLNNIKLAHSNILKKVSHISFIISLSASFWLLWTNLYFRPSLYFILIVICVVSIILEIFALSENIHNQKNIILFKIIILSLSVYGGIYYEFPGIYGADAWWHHEWIQEIISIGHNTTGFFLTNGYYLMPIFHMDEAINSIVTNLSINNCVFISIGLFISISSIFIFFIARKMTDNIKVSLLVSLILPLTDWAVIFGTGIIPNSLGYCFFVVISYFIICRNMNSFNNMLITILLSIILIFTHSISSFIMLIVLIALFITTRIYRNINKSKTITLVSGSLILIFIVLMFITWTQNYTENSNIFTDIMKGFISSLETDATILVASTEQANSSIIIKIFNQGGFILLIFFALIGSLVFLQSRNRNGRNVAFIITVGILYIIPYLFQQFNLIDIVPGRWYLFIYTYLVILAVKGLFHCVNKIRSNIIKITSLAFFTSLIIVLMVVDNPANTDSPFVNNGVTRMGYTKSELTALYTIANMECGNPFTDDQYGDIIPYVIGNDKYAEMVQRNNSIFILRNYFINHPEWNGSYKARINLGIYHDNFSPDYVVIWNYLKEQDIFNQPLIYDNGNVQAYSISSILSKKYK